MKSDVKGEKFMEKKKRIITRIISVCLVALMGVTSFPITSFAATPTIDSSFKKMTIGKNQLKDSQYYDYNEDLAGYFKAPSTGKYSIYVVNNGNITNQDVVILDEDFAVVEKGDYVSKAEKYTFNTISLKKNEKIYLYVEPSFGYYNSGEMIAAKVVIKQVSKNPTLNKTSLSLKKGKSYTLKLKNNKNSVIWVSSKKSVATVTSKGVVKAKKKGTAYIYAIAKHRLYKCKVTVKN